MKDSRIHSVDATRTSQFTWQLCFGCALIVSLITLMGLLLATDGVDSYLAQAMKMIGLDQPSDPPTRPTTKTSEQPTLQPTDTSDLPNTHTTTAHEGFTTASSVPFQQCILPNLDPLDASILPYVDPKNDPMKDCKPTFVPLTRVRNGRVDVIREAAKDLADCEFRCNYPQGDYHTRLGEWESISLTPDCDVFEVHCRDSDGNVSYEYVHTQIYTNRTSNAEPSPEPAKNPARPPDVHVLVIDSVSSAQLMRSMPKSLRFLEEEMGAINFRYLNKVGHNSRPNAYPLFFGRLHNASDDRDDWSFCKQALDNQSFVGFGFRRSGYKTMMAEDWAAGVFDWPGCEGFQQTPMDHYMRPFQRLYDDSDEKEKWKKKLIDGQCRGGHIYVLNYFKAFLDAYSDAPKFSIMWLVELAHYDVNGLYPLDDFFLRLLKNYKAKLNNAFFFIMGDHGMRFGDIRQTKQGAIEDNNPALVLVVPEHLRKNPQMMSNLKANSKQLVTHYDTHATLVNIAREHDSMAPDRPFEHLDTTAWNVTLQGESYLYPFSVPRNCASLRVHFSYCICQNATKNVTLEKQSLARRMSSHVVGHVNDYLRTKKAMDVCSELVSDPNRTPELLYFTVEAGMHRITLRALPNDGIYEAHVKVFNEDNEGGNEAFSIVLGEVTRLDAYEAQANCTQDYEVKPFCYCRSLLKN